MIDKLIQALEREHASQLEGCDRDDHTELLHDQYREMSLLVGALRSLPPDAEDVLDSAFDAAIEHELEAQRQRDASRAMDRRLARESF